MDKILHFLLAFMIALAVGGVTESSTLGLVAGLIAGAGKEILNALTGGTVELLDAYGTEGDGLEFKVFDWNSKGMMEVRPWTK
jgi:hypothetical protein